MLQLHQIRCNLHMDDSAMRFTAHVVLLFLTEVPPTPQQLPCHPSLVQGQFSISCPVVTILCLIFQCTVCRFVVDASLCV